MPQLAGNVKLFLEIVVLIRQQREAQLEKATEIYTLLVDVLIGGDCGDGVAQDAELRPWIPHKAVRRVVAEVIGKALPLFLLIHQLREVSRNANADFARALAFLVQAVCVCWFKVVVAQAKLLQLQLAGLVDLN